jgi:hypothetical protein
MDEERILKQGVSFSLCGRGCSFSRDFKRRMRVFYQENFYWGIQKTFKRRLWKWATLYIGALLGNLRGL